jgi:hypothetical protein
MAGILSGLFFALISERSFKIHWPGFDHVFAPRTVEWSFDPASYDIPANELETSGFVNDVHGDGKVTRPFSSYNQGCMFNDLNTCEIGNPVKWKPIENFPHVFYHSNRDPTPDNYKRVADKYHWPAGDGNQEHNYYIAYRCLFNDMMTPATTFLNTTYKPLGMDAVPFQDIVSIVEDLDHVSLAYHHRIPDHHLATDPVESRISDAEIAWLISFGEQHRSESTRKMNLFFITNSMNSANKLIAHEGIRKTYEHVYSHELTGGVHINYEKTSSSHSLKQAMMDWWVMRQVHYLVCGGSGFCKMAAMVADETQVQIDGSSKQVTPRVPVIRTDRHC